MPKKLSEYEKFLFLSITGLVVAVIASLFNTGCATSGKQCKWQCDGAAAPPDCEWVCDKECEWDIDCVNW